jgi:hypothetical protein
MGGICRTTGRYCEMHTKLRLKNLKLRGKLEDLGENQKKILKLILKENVRVKTGFILKRKETSGGFLITR